MSTSDSPTATELLYGGRGYLRRSRLTFANLTDLEQTEPIYSSEGLLFSRKHLRELTRDGSEDDGETSTPQATAHVTDLFYFAGRPVAQWHRDALGGGTYELLYLTTDHLGTPILATDILGVRAWEGGLDPFGDPYIFPCRQVPEDGDHGAEQGSSSISSETMEAAGIFLRFPGQWDDSSFRSLGVGSRVYYNLHRWYQPGSGRYTRNDPLHRPTSTVEDYYRYALSSPLIFVDPLGLFSIEPGCKECRHPDLARDNRPLSTIIQKEVQVLCATGLNRIVDVNLRRCIAESCRSGVIGCALKGSQCDEPGNTGYTENAGIGLYHWLRRNGWLPVIRKAILCANSSLNFSGEAGRTVIHEWAHGCGYSAHGSNRYPGIPQSED
jgi:RHS repeat-associated protein